MANIFRRIPIAGGDNNTWAPYLLAIISDSVGCYSSYLYDDSGTLKLSKGKIGINNDTNEGICLIDTVTTITLDATNGIWQKIEVSVFGSAVTLSATAIAGKTDPSVVPTEFTGAYDPEKSGYYISTTKRCIGVIFKNSAGVLDGIVNAENNILGYYGTSYLVTAHTNQIWWEKKQGLWKCHTKLQIGLWNMTDGTQVRHITHNINGLKIKNIFVVILDDAGNPSPLINATPTAVLSGFFRAYVTDGTGNINTVISLGMTNAVGNWFNTVSYNDPAINRGYIYLDLDE